MVKGKVTNFRRGPLMRFCDGEFRTDGGGWAAYTLQPAQRPRAITLRTRQGVLLAGIFKVDGNKLTLCLSHKPGGPRPTCFKAEKGEPFELFVLRRAKE
jgi:hypothetical protein